MSLLDPVSSNPNARVLVVSQRHLHRSISRATVFEFEDGICEFDDAELVAPRTEMEIRNEFARRTQKLVRRVLPFPRRSWLPRRFELLFVPCEDLSDVPKLGPLDRWFECARSRVCWIEEVWNTELEKNAAQVELLRGFDMVLLSTVGSVEALSRAIGKPVHYMPPGVDAIRFCPFPDEPARVVDVFNMGRRDEHLHRRLHELARERNWYYVYDTFTGNQTLDPQDHRVLLGNTIKRTRYFIANRSKFDEPALTERQEEISTRLPEGVAGGAVMIGRAPRTPMFGEHFGWPDAIVPMIPDGTDLREVIDSLERDPVRVARIRRDNVCHALRRHDWVHRWKWILDRCGLAAPPAVQQRIDALERLAQVTEQRSGEMRVSR